MIMTLWEIFAYMGQMLNDFLAIFSLLGTFILFVSGLLRLRSGSGESRLDRIADKTLFAFFFGVIFQIAQYSTNNVPERIGFMLRLQPMLVNVMFFISLLFLIGRIVLSIIKRSFA